MTRTETEWNIVPVVRLNEYNYMDVIFNINANLLLQNKIFIKMGGCRVMYYIELNLYLYFLAEFSLYVHKGGIKPHYFHFIYLYIQILL